MAARLGGLCFLAFGLLGPISTDAGELIELAPRECIEALAGAPDNGLATGVLVAKPLVRLCDGSWREVSFEEGRLLLSVTSKDGRHDSASDLSDTLRLPDGEITRGPNRIAMAWLIGPTTIYRHGILGDGIEASGIHVRLSGGGRRELFLGQASVFEDLRARLVDLNGDGVDEVLVIRSYLDRGASLAVYGLSGSGLTLLGETPPIGLPNRWLNPAGAADFDGDGEIEIAIVETPHIGGILRIFALREEGLVEEQAAPNFSNHALGSRNLDLSAVLDWDLDGVADLALPDASRRVMRVVGLTGGEVQVLASQAHDEEIAMPVRSTDLNADGVGELLYGLGNGRLVMLKP